MALNPDVGGQMDQSIPQWKRELILRRRAVGRTLQVGNSSVKLTCPAVVAIVRQPEICVPNVNNALQTQNSLSSEDSAIAAVSSSLNQNRVDFHPSTSSSAVSVGNMRLLDTCSDVNNLINGIDVKNKQSEVISSDFNVDYNSIMGEDKSVKKKSSSRSKFGKQISNNQQNLIIKNIKIEDTNVEPLKDDDNQSDSSEELQYGPGIVNKLKSKYLSMTLREHKRISRPSIINLRRATSLENMLEDDDVNKHSKVGVDSLNKTEHKTISNRTTHISQPIIGLSTTQMTKYLGNRSLETMKRARSMDTLLKCESRTAFNKITNEDNHSISNNPVRSNHKPITSVINENIIIVENVHHRPTSTDASIMHKDMSNGSAKHAKRTTTGELPPPDVVKQTLKIFETSPKKNAKLFNQSSLSKCAVGVSNNSNCRHIQQRNTSIKPILSPKPVLSPERIKQNRSRITSPKKTQNNIDLLGSVQSRIQTVTLDRPLQFEQSDLKCNTAIKSDAVVVASPKIISSRSISPIVTVLTNNEQLSHTSESTIDINSKSVNLIQSSNIDAGTGGTSIASDECEEIDGSDYSKPVLESDLENIRRGGVTVQFSFMNEKTHPPLTKSYLPRSRSPTQVLNAPLVKGHLEQLPPTTNIAPLRQQILPHTKQVGIIRPLVSRPHSSPALTEQEIEKNLINRVKSIEQPISKVVVAIKALPETVIGSLSSDVVTNKNLSLPRVCSNSKLKTQRLWDEKLWHQNQNTIVFNFSDRKEVPDYIENDGLILRGKKDRPRPGEGGIILPDAGVEESSTDIDDPPSPCDVTFEGDNVLINGKSNLKKAPKQVKLRIKFNDDATTMFEYPSEASLIEEEPSASETSPNTVASGSDEADSQASAVSSSTPRPLALGGSLGAYTPRQMGAGGWQLGVTPVVSPTPTPTEPSNLTPEEDHLKPAPPESTVAWSEDTASDLLF